MNKLALIILATASALAPSAAFAQTVSPPEENEGTPQVALKKPARTAPQTSTAPVPPAGITWRNQAAPAPVVAPSASAPMSRAAPPPPPAVVRPVAPLPAPPLARSPLRAEAAPPPPPLPLPRAGGPGLPNQHFVIRRRAGEVPGAPADIIIRRDMDGGLMLGPDHGPARVVVRRERMGDMDYHGDWAGEGHDGPAYEEHDGHGGYEEEGHWGDGEESYPAGHPGYQQGYAYGPCCSGGMITETITTTTTYPPTVEERVVHHQTPSHPPRRTYKRKLRGR